jgi:type II secretory pathway component PulK
MKIHVGKKNRGIAVIVALIAITVLAMMAAGFALSMKVETQLAANSNNDEQMLWLGRAGMEYARWVLAQEAAIPAQPYDSLNQKWAGGEGDINESNTVLASISLDNVPLGDVGTVSVKIVDHERYVNINTANTAILQQVLTTMGVDADDISVVSDSIQDWVQSGDAPRVAGAKNDFYQALSPPYYCKEAPIDDLSELLLVRGVTSAMYWGGSETNQGGVSFHHHLGLGNAPGEAADYPFGFTNVFTPVSTGQVNINTADATVLQILPGMDAESAQNIIKMRSGPDGVDGTIDDTPFRSVSQLAAAGVNQQAIQQMSQLCTVRSSTFDATVTAHIGPLTRVYHAILLRNTSTDIQIVGFYWQ